MGTGCEILWIKLQLAGSFPLHIAAYYKPSESDTKSCNGVNGKGPHMGIGRFLTSRNFAGWIISPPFPLTVSTHTSMRSSSTS